MGGVIWKANEIREIYDAGGIINADKLCKRCHAVSLSIQTQKRGEGYCGSCARQVYLEEEERKRNGN